MDAASRKILGFTLSERHDAAAAYGALAMAVTVRGGTAPGVIMHTDQGSEGGFNRLSQHRLAELRSAVHSVLRLVSSSRVFCAAAR
jgi:transposase InsO family protein